MLCLWHDAMELGSRSSPTRRAGPSSRCSPSSRADRRRSRRSSGSADPPSRDNSVSSRMPASYGRFPTGLTAVARSTRSIRTPCGRSPRGWRAQTSGALQPRASSAIRERPGFGLRRRGFAQRAASGRQAGGKREASAVAGAVARGRPAGGKREASGRPARWPAGGQREASAVARGRPARPAGGQRSPLEPFRDSRTARNRRPAERIRPAGLPRRGLPYRSGTVPSCRVTMPPVRPVQRTSTSPASAMISAMRSGDG